MLLHNENKLDEMGKIMTHYMTLVPATSAEGHFTLPSGDIMSFDDTRFHKVLFGGDQLTVARMRGTLALRDTQDKLADRLEGLIPVVEDDTNESKTHILIIELTCHARSFKIRTTVRA